MASAIEHAPSAGEYIGHHLTHLNSIGHKQAAVIDWSVINVDTLFWSVAMGALAIFLLMRAASRATSGVPGRFQAAVEILVDMVESQSKSIVHGDRTFIAPLALTVFMWVLFMNAMDFFPVDLFPRIWEGFRYEVPFSVIGDLR
jgi:F-type H+-transporting ATPase subunit a